MNEEDALAIQRAEYHLNKYPVSTEPSAWVEGKITSKVHGLNPKEILKAVLKFAPTEEGKVNLAKAIMNKVGETDASETVSNAGVEAFARQVIWNLLVPSLFLHLRH